MNTKYTTKANTEITKTNTEITKTNETIDTKKLLETKQTLLTLLSQESFKDLKSKYEKRINSNEDPKLWSGELLKDITTKVKQNPDQASVKGAISIAESLHTMGGIDTAAYEQFKQEIAALSAPSSNKEFHGAKSLSFDIPREFKEDDA